MSVSEPESGIHSLWRLKTNTYRTACGTSEQLASGTLNGRFREGSPGRTVKKSAITGAVLGPKCFRTVLAQDRIGLPAYSSKTVGMFITVAPDARGQSFRNSC